MILIRIIEMSIYIKMNQLEFGNYSDFLSFGGGLGIVKFEGVRTIVVGTHTNFFGFNHVFLKIYLMDSGFL